MKRNYTIKYHEVNPTQTLEWAVRECSSSLLCWTGDGDALLELKQDLGKPVVHWTIRIPLEVILKFPKPSDIPSKVFPFSIDGYIEPTGGTTIVRSKMAREKSNEFAPWEIMRKKPVLADIFYSHKCKLVDESALKEALEKVKEESKVWLLKHAASLLLSPPPASSPISTSLNLA